MVREKAERLAKEEEEKKRAEREAREALVAQRKEERRLAKQASPRGRLCSSLVRLAPVFLFCPWFVLHC